MYWQSTPFALIRTDICFVLQPRALSWAAALLLALGLAACQVTPSAAPTHSATTLSPTTSPGLPTPLPKDSATASPRPLTDATQAVVLEPPVPPPSPTPAPLPFNLPLEQLVIYEPGPGSQITSPFRIVGRGGPSYQERIHLRLLGQDGRVLSENNSILFAYPGNAGRFVSYLSFNIDHVAEAGLLQIESFDERTGRVDHITSQHLVLLTAGSPLVHQALQGPEKLTIRAPKKDQMISGGSLDVALAGWVDSNSPLQIDILNRSGNVVGTASAPLNAPSIGQLGTLQTKIEYTVPYAQYGQLQVTERDSQTDEIIHMSSVEIYLQP